ncbi:signal peptidase I [Liquorilactobacillus satsumensis]|uniref:Signal peptidase I n=1 Tax=Liquorilactobacillus satsumensis DSM 16230 = JCM 12392 TaxID=1423801 RepID=A0A0R1V1R5_9LACO|nr:signal peptidase I [Liquorilactobacillus satsumensis]KRL99504.1 Signal peptidase I [Liquorilactobacillus satsumensis DSM 16230 = JCM 12392]MCC7665981.1 signal peptidase I [Liquorilactobacillus satsumensis]MCP9312059.1 signal peptidase I [Liquorilactobacillus satsumensis]MCP9327854.1 signal peptidase I [Liquorilactobacillus satsumensis]MCP9356687.1 signal peptidase I [Liquorilactobacillus satsumensis]
MKHSWKRFRKKFHLSYWFPLVFFALLAALFVKSFLIVPLQIAGNSMEPTLYSREDALVMNFGKIRRFDVVTIKMPDGQTYIKRVIGMPGDRLEYRNDHLYINGKIYQEKFLRSVLRGKHSPYTADFKLAELIGTTRVPANQYFVLGDNRKISKDSRTFGPVEDSWIKGKALIIYWPLNKVRWIGHN